MAEIEITLPTVQYGNVKVRATPEELGLHVANPGQMGSAVAVYLNLFSQGFKEGAAMDVVYASEDLPDRRLAARQYADSKANAEYVIGSDAPGDVQAAALDLLNEAAPGDPQAAADRLADGRSPRTVDEANEMARQVIESELGPTTEVDGQDPEGPGEEPSRAPWDKPAAEVTKPWETDSGW